MKKILLVALCLMCLMGTVSAYGLYIKCDESVLAGQTIKCTIDSDFPAGKSFYLVLYQSGYTSTEISKQTVTLQEDQKTLYRIFDTQGLPGGTYKVEIQYMGADEPQLRSDSMTMQLVKVIDRSSEIEITSPLTQKLSEALRIEGSLKNGGANGIKMEVRGPDGRIFGPDYIPTTNDVKNGAGIFTKKITVSTPGTYDVDFADSKSFISRVTFTVAEPTAAPTTVIPTTTAPLVQKPPQPVTTVPTPWPTTTQSPLSPLTLIGAAGCAGALAIFMRRKE